MIDNCLEARRIRTAYDAYVGSRCVKAIGFAPFHLSHFFQDVYICHSTVQIRGLTVNSLSSLSTICKPVIIKYAVMRELLNGMAGKIGIGKVEIPVVELVI